MSSSLGITRVPAESPVSAQIEQQKTQRDEYQSFTISKMVGPIERVLRDLYNAAVLTANAKGTKDVSGIFRKIVVRIPSWTDDEVAREFPENTADIDACIRMAVRAHATVIALTRNKACKQVIKVPNAQAFFRKILMEVAMDHEPEMFGTKKLSQRNKLRHWIEDCIVNHLIGLVPISLFATEDEQKEEEPPKSVCAEESCPVVHHAEEKEVVDSPPPAAAAAVEEEEIVEETTVSSPDFGTLPDSPATLKIEEQPAAKVELEEPKEEPAKPKEEVSQAEQTPAPKEEPAKTKVEDEEDEVV